MKSTFTNERVLGTRAPFSADAPDIKSKFTVGLANLFRCPLQIPVYLAVGSRPESMATSVNISDMGVALTNSPPLQVGDRVTLRFTLPHTDAAAKINAEVCWCDPAGASGLEFVQVPPKIKEQLVSWMATRLEEYLSDKPL